METTQQTTASASLYVGDLTEDVIEKDLFEVFSPIGTLASIRLIRDSATLRSLRYAYVNYEDVQSAERALDVLNHTPIKGKACRVMWKNNDISIRKSGVGNLFVKNLALTVDNKVLNEAFSIYGNILSCKVSANKRGESAGFGFVQFDSAEAANLAIEKLHNTELEGKTIFVAHFKCRKDRESEIQASIASKAALPFTNVYVKDFPVEFTEETLRSLFTPFGTVQSLFIKTDAKLGKPFGFVNFEEPAAAAAAVEALNGRFTTVDGLKPAEETESLLAAATEVAKAQLEEQAKAAATEEAAAAIRARTVLNIPGRIYVSRAQSRLEREAALRAQFEERGRTAPTPFVNLYIKYLSAEATDEKIREVFGKFNARVVSAKVHRDRETNEPRGFGFVGLDSEQAALAAVAALHNQFIEGLTAEGKQLHVSLAEKRTPKAQRDAAAEAPVRPAHRQNNKRQNNGPNGNRNNQKRQQLATAMATPASAGAQLLEQIAKLATEEEKKRAIGERLFVAIATVNEPNAAKLTGMMLDMPPQLLCALLDNQEALRNKVQEGIEILKANNLLA